MDHAVEEQQETSLNGPPPPWKMPPPDLEVGHVADPGGDRHKWRGLRGLLVAQIFGQFNDQAWKQLVILLAMAAVVGEAKKQERTAIVTMMLLIPLTIISLPAGVLADRVSKRSVLIAMKALELILMLAGAAALFVQPHGGWLSIGVLGLVGVQTAFFVPAKYGILPEILPHERLSAGNGLLEMTSNLAMLAGIVGGGIILYLVGNHTWAGRFDLGLVLSRIRFAGVLDDSTGQGRPSGRRTGDDRTPGVGIDQRRSGAAFGTDRPGVRLDDRHVSAARCPGLRRDAPGTQ